MPNKFKGKSKWQASSKTPNASFRTRRRGTVGINLATRGTTPENNKAYARVSTRKGDINVNLYSLQAGKRINLDASSKRGECVIIFKLICSVLVRITNIWLTGHILIFIPRNFCGAIQLKSRKNGYQILPALACASRTLRTKNHEALILVGDPTSSSTSPDTADDLAADFCQLESRGGKVTVGFTGEDKYVPTEIGMWQKVEEFFKGKSS
jgi:hypothetical protein